MKCEWVQQNVVLYVYDELPDDARYELEQHVSRCTTCAAEVESTKKFRADFSKLPVQEPSANFIATSRLRLQEALEGAEQGGWWHRIAFDPLAWLNQIRFAPALAAAIFIVGFAGGIGATYRMIKGTPVEIGPVTQTTGAPTQASIGTIESVSQQPGSNQVTVKYDTVSPQVRTGSLNDPNIQQLLLYAARNNFNAGVRMDSVDLLTQQPNEAHVREALMSDANPCVRIEALRLLVPVRADSSVQVVLRRLAARDENRYIRSQARTLIAQLPEMN